MKHRLLYVLMGILCTLSVVAQTSANNIYIYRNDGKFNAFMAHEVDSLAYSNRDLNGIEHPNAVIQEIWTADSVYRIPLSVIDSVSVVTPKTIYAPGVKKLSPDYVPYIKQVNDLSITFSNDLPHALRINKGDILLYEKFDELFVDGFAGKVTSISSIGENLEVSCEPVTLPEIYEQYIAVGDYVVEEDPQNKSRLKAMPAKKVTAEFRPKVTLDASLNLGPVSITGGLDNSLYIKIVANISKGQTYIELTYKSETETKVGVSVSGEIGSLRTEPNVVTIPVPFPSTIIQVDVQFATFVQLGISGSANLNLNRKITEGRTIIYKDGQLSSTVTPPTSTFGLDGSINLEGDLWLGALIRPRLHTIGNLVGIDEEVGAGPYCNFNMAFNPTVFESLNAYERLKDSSFSHGNRIREGYQYYYWHPIRLRTERVTVAAREYNVGLTDAYMFPEFEDLEVTSDSKSITVSTTAVRPVFPPCEVGLCVLDEEGTIVDSYYSDERKHLLNTELKLNHTFSSNLKKGVKYTVCPIIRYLGVELQATPEEECYLDCELNTGKSSSTLNSFEASGSIGGDISSNAKVGFAYTSDKVNPRKENAKLCEATLIDSNTFKGAVSGLSQGTTYYYCAYVCYGDTYYYGDTQCITTKRNIDEFNGDNFGGDYIKGNKPYAETGVADNVEMKTATIELTFHSVSPSTHCGYYLQADSKKGSTLTSKYCELGTVTGIQTVELTNLLPGTQYTYWAVEKNSSGISKGSQRSFKTEPSPDPVAKILDVKDIDMQSAVISCYFDNLEDAEECGIEYVDGNFSYKEKIKPSADGKGEIKLDKLTAETNYKVKPYVKLVGEDEPFYDDEETRFSTLGPDITGWWVFNDGQGGDGGRVHDVEFRSNGRTDNFYGVNYLTWNREGRKITMRWCTPYPSNSYWEYRGTFNEDFTRVTGEAVYVFDFEPTDSYDEMFKSTFWLRRK